VKPAEFRDGPGQIEPYNGLPCYNPTSLPPELEFTEAILDAHGDALYALGQLSTLHATLRTRIFCSLLSWFGKPR